MPTQSRGHGTLCVSKPAVAVRAWAAHVRLRVTAAPAERGFVSNPSRRARPGNLGRLILRHVFDAPRGVLPAPHRPLPGDKQPLAKPEQSAETAGGTPVAAAAV
jgi:hypothetical protein